MPIRRRTFMHGAAATAAAGAFLRPRTGRAFGEVPTNLVDQMLPGERQVKNILEIHLLGGVSQYESFYAVPEYGVGDADSATQWNLTVASGALDDALQNCNLNPTEVLTDFAVDGAGAEVRFGPFVDPLRNRPDLMERLRVVATSHIAAPHEVAIPLTVTGRVPGRPDVASMGTHVSRYELAQRGRLDVPTAYVLQPQSATQRGLVTSAVATGYHPGTARPFSLRTDDAALLDLLQRSQVGDRRGAHDAVVQAMSEQFRSKLVLSNGESLEAALVTNHDAATAAMQNVDQLVSILDDQLFDPIAPVLCGQSTSAYVTGMNLRLATHLLTRPDRGIRYVQVFDGGFGDTSNAGGYDGHSSNARAHALNLHECMRSLTELINTAGENDPDKLNLDETLIVINTEFGRTPTHEGTQLGRGHWPQGYPVVYLGGPVGAEQRGIYGALGADARATESVSPVEHRVAMLAALGIYPFEPESYNVADVPGAIEERDAIEGVLTRVFG